MERVTVYTDGACLKNPGGAGGYAAVIIGLEGQPMTISGREDPTTNNRMEMRAVIEGLNALEPGVAVEIVTDSEYVLKGYTEWLPVWVRRGWRTSGKKAVKNQELWADMLAAVQRHSQAASVSWRWTRGHDGDRFNELADEIANACAQGR